MMELYGRISRKHQNPEVPAPKKSQQKNQEKGEVPRVGLESVGSVSGLGK